MFDHGGRESESREGGFERMRRIGFFSFPLNSTISAQVKCAELLIVSYALS